MRKVSLAKGTWTSGIGFIGAGVLAVAPHGSLPFYVGLGLIVAGIFVLVWGVNLNGRHWWLGISNKVRPRQWEPMHLGLRYIALKSAWAFTVPEGAPAQLDALLKREVGERLARGELRARGRKVVCETPYRLTATTEPIPDDFWVTAFFQPFGEIVIAESTRGAAARDGEYTHVSKRSFREILLSSEDILRIWPEAGRKVRRERKTAFHEALLRYWKGDYRGDGEYRTKFDMWAAGG